MNQSTATYDGALIDELGVNLYLRSLEDLKTSNINFLIRGGEAERAWQECNFGCHGPTYRQLKRHSTFAEALKPIEDRSPALAGFIDGLHAKTVGNVEKIASGVERTADGLYVNGDENFNNVGAENNAAYQLVTTSIQKLFSFEINTIDNPLAQIVYAIINRYISILPSWAITEITQQGALKIPEKIDTLWVLKAASLGVIDNINADNLSEATSLLSNTAQRQAGKVIGKKTAVALGAIIAAQVTKKIINNSAEIHLTKRRLVELRSKSKSLKGGLGSSLITLLKIQGLLGQAAASSRALHQACPKLWNHMRYKLNGADMIYFLIENMTQEYVDRLALLERSPQQFIMVMRALIKDKQTISIFFPRSK
ncbi:hypothetical protein [Saccharophagus degradans]|uniref:Uncharacterized protein n=1 Tax=Saccharophagus degradans (strain 2-40 / ATCC 43961 / DSM 17024) TaxID=203122 RepID=Q21DW5_SACD2|nr:hypothetical protein [Saccharophagus degradans]ABD83114.1 hypothetical protein Sde_3859 [Saccharophagus degradans 2-40]